MSDFFDELFEELDIPKPEATSAREPTGKCTGLPSGELCIYCDERGRCHALKECKHKEKMEDRK